MIPRTLKRMVTVFSVCASLAVSLWLGEGTCRAMPPVQRLVLPNGLVILLSEEHSLPLVTVELLVDAGSRRDPPGKEGLANLTANGLLLGSNERSAAALNEELDFMGASLEASAEKDYGTLTLQVLRKDLDRGFSLFLEALTQPTFPDKELNREVRKTLAAIQAEEEQPEELARSTFEQTLFGSSPYGHPPEGTRESLPRIAPEDVRRFYRTYYRPTIATLAVVGDITFEAVEAQLIPRLTQWPAGTVPPEQFRSTLAQGPKTETIERKSTQTTIILGHGGISRDNPDYYAVSVMNYILGGGGFGSRLMEEIRVKRGLAYSVESFFEAGKYPGSFEIVCQTKNASTREAITLAVGQMERMKTEMVSQNELDQAKKYLIGSFPFRLDTQGEFAHFLTLDECFGLGLDYPERYPALIRSVTREEVLQAAKTYLHPQQYILVVVGNLKEMDLEKQAGQQ